MGWIRRRGHKLYYCFTDVDGTERTRLARGCTSREQVRPLLAEAERRVQAGQMGVPEKPTEEQRQRNRLTVRELGERFLAEYQRPALKDRAAYVRSAASKWKVRINPLIGSRAAASLTLGDVEALRDALAAKPFELEPASIVRTLATLSRAYNWSRRAKVVDCANPVQGVERPRASSSLDYLSAEEVDALLRHAEQLARVGVASWVGLMLPAMVATAVHTGMRLGELHGLAWSAVDFQAKRIDVLRSYDLAPKSGEARHLPINAELLPVLEAWQKLCPATADGLVFPVEGRDGFRMGDAGSLRGALQALLAGAGCHVPEKPWHALRHTFASHAVMSGTPLYTVQQLLGHSTPIMTQRYSHLAPDHLADAVAGLSFRSPKPAAPIPDGAATTSSRARRAARSASLRRLG